MTLSFHGIPAAPGKGLGHIVVYRTAQLTQSTAQTLPTRPPAEEWQHFLTIQAQVDQEIYAISQTANSVVADIFSSQRAILNDPTLIEPIHIAIESNRISAVEAVQKTVDKLVWQFRLMQDEYFASRATDLLDIGTRLLERLEGEKESAHVELSRESILIAEELVPSDLVKLLPESHSDQILTGETIWPDAGEEAPATEEAPHPIQGIALVHGSPIAHLSILARTLDIPMICGLPDSIMAIAEGATAMLDGDSGLLQIDPSEDEIKHQHQNSQITQFEGERSVDINKLDTQPPLADASNRTQTQDGTPIALFASVNSLGEARKALQVGANGIGLLRTEFLFHGDVDAPDVARHVTAYAEILSLWQPRLTTLQLMEHPSKNPIHFTIRALDIGGDKPVPFSPHLHETNPVMGNRGMRLLLQQPELLEAQITAVLRLARQSGLALRFMLPMVTNLAELEETKALVNACSEKEGIAEADLAKLFALGVLIETPAAALMAGHFLPHVDFLAIGANDLTQYTLAVDRSNRSVMGLVDPLHPAVLQLMSMVCQVGTAAQIPVGLCGGSASDPAAIPLLLGLGLTEFSTIPSAIKAVRTSIHHATLETCQQLAAEAMKRSSPQKVRELLSHE